MHELINKLAFSLFKKNSLEECSTEEIEDLAKQYPYFSSAQLLLAARQNQSDHPEFEKQLITTSLHVNNPLWLDHLLNSSPVKEDIVEVKLPSTEVDEEPNNDELVLEKRSHDFIVASTQQEVITAPLPAAVAEPVIEKAEQKEQPLFSC